MKKKKKKTNNRKRLLEKRTQRVFAVCYTPLTPCGNVILLCAHVPTGVSNFYARKKK